MADRAGTFAFSIVGSVLLSTACGGEPFTSSATGGTSGAGGAGVGGAAGEPSGGAAGAAPSLCPTLKPAADSACNDEGLACSYTHDPRPRCRPRFQCESGQWKVISEPDTNCTKLDSCPLKPPAPTDSCTVSGSTCVYETLGIFCSCMSAGTVNQWRCALPPAPPCPSHLPNEGEQCVDKMSCAYGSCTQGDGVTAVCDGSIWIWTQIC